MQNTQVGKVWYACHGLKDKEATKVALRPTNGINETNDVINGINQKFVKIETTEEIITGTGLEAKQDFSTWSIKQPEATFLIEEDEGEEEL